MAKKIDKYDTSLKEALGTFDLKHLKGWMKKNNPMLYKSFKDTTQLIQMATMCKMICARTDMLNTEAYKRAIEWLAKHDMKGRFF